jgi:peptide/nickel transport system substrate-binding protein
MRSIGSPQFAVNSLMIAGALLFSGRAGLAATHPRQGGTLRVELRTLSVSLDPREWKLGTEQFAAEEKLAALVFERLITLDRYGRFQPQLASGWSHDASLKRWVFSLRQNVKFSDGTPMTAPDIASALQPLLPHGLQITASAGNVVIQSNNPAPDLLEELASGRLFVYRPTQDGALIGTGPFFVAESEKPTDAEGSQTALSSIATSASAQRSGSSASKVRFLANELAWSGRPFVNSIEVTLGVPALRQLLDLQLGKADIVELAPDLVRRASRENVRVWASDPVTLYALRFAEKSANDDDPNFRESLNLSLDRATMASVLLQKQAEPASALFPQWLSGYAFLFKAETNMTRANEIRATLSANPASAGVPLRLAIDAPGDLPRLLAERVVVNAREARLRLQLAGHGINGQNMGSANAKDPGSELHLFAWRYSTLSPRREFEAFLTAILPGELATGAVSSSDPEELFSRERKVLDDRHVLPLVAVPDYAGIGQHVRNWMPARWGEWNLADVWLDRSDSGAAKDLQSGISARTTPGTGNQAGVKP